MNFYLFIYFIYLFIYFFQNDNTGSNSGSGSSSGSGSPSAATTPAPAEVAKVAEKKVCLYQIIMYIPMGCQIFHCLGVMHAFFSIE